MNQSQIYDELQVYIDESGNLNQPGKEEILLVGGILVWRLKDTDKSFKKYKDIDSLLKKCLEEALVETYHCKDYSYLHYYDKDCRAIEKKVKEVAWDKKNEFLLNLSLRLDECIEDIGKNELFEINGFFVLHKEDMNLQSSSLVSEESMDNRYLSMLKFGLEHLLFVCEKTRSRLTKNARVSIQVANRRTESHYNTQQQAESDKKLYKSKGYKPELSNTTITVSSILSKEGLGVMLSDISKRWHSMLELEPGELSSISYGNKMLSDAGYYLADLFLGQKRNAIKWDKSNDCILPEYTSISYESASDELAKCVNAPNITTFIDLLWRRPDLVCTDIFKEFKSGIAPKLTIDDICPLLEKVKKEVDSVKPDDLFLHTQSIMTNFQDLVQYNPELDCNETWKLTDWIELSQANHLGNIEYANDIWKRYVEHKKAGFGFENRELELDFDTEMTLRRVVNLMDRFRYTEAKQLTHELCEKQEYVYNVFKEQDTQQIQYRPDLGRCYSTLGQIKAFMARTETDYLEAVKLFKQTLQFYDPKNDKQGDIVRTWIYIGHVACDLQWHGMNSARELWNEICSKLQLSLHNENDWTFLKTDIDHRYYLALQMKAILLFDDIAIIPPFIKAWNNPDNIIANVIDKEKNSPKALIHPFGFILQTLAMLYARLYREEPTDENWKKTIETYDVAINVIKAQKTKLFDFLALITEMRQSLFKIETHDNEEEREHLHDIYLDVKALLCCDFGEGAWEENTEGEDSGYFGSHIRKNDPVTKNAQQIIDMIQFNYW